MDPKLQKLIDDGVLFGEFDSSKVSGLTPTWFADRQVDFLDFRGDLRFLDTEILLGRHVRMITASHVINTGRYGGTALKYVWIEAYAFIGSYSLLYNCHIGEGAVVNCGSVVSNMVVEPYTMVEGNPARVVGRFENGLWRRV